MKPASHVFAAAIVGSASQRIHSNYARKPRDLPSHEVLFRYGMLHPAVDKSPNMKDTDAN
jgi:hypothetical protein